MTVLLLLTVFLLGAMWAAGFALILWQFRPYTASIVAVLFLWLLLPPASVYLGLVLA